MQLRSNGGQPGSVALGEVVVAAAAEVEFFNPGWPDVEGGSGSGEGDVLRSAGGAQVGVIGHGAVAGECYSAGLNGPKYRLTALSRSVFGPRLMFVDSLIDTPYCCVLTT